MTNLNTNEDERLTELKRFHIMDTSPEEELDNLVDLAAAVCETPIALISLLDSTRQWFKAKVGIQAAETPRDQAFCAHAIQNNEPFIVEDATKDERFSTNPLVLNAPNVCFYAGIPLITNHGYALGTLCVIDVIPRTLTDRQKKALKALANQVLTQLDKRLWMNEKESLRKELEEQKIQTRSASKLAALGQMTATIVHEIINPLTGAQGKINMLKQKLDVGNFDSEGLKTLAVRASVLVDRIVKIVEGLRSMSRNSDVEEEQEIRIHDLIEDTLTFCSDGIQKHGIRLCLEDSLENATLKCKKIQLSQVLLNLLNNAVDAIEGLPEKWIRIDTRSEPDFFELSVTDSGSGIPEKLRETIFLPLFTTKKNKGSGIGLSISKEIIESHGGTLSLDVASPNTRFVIQIAK